MISAKLTAEST